VQCNQAVGRSVNRTAFELDRARKDVGNELAEAITSGDHHYRGERAICLFAMNAIYEK